MPNDGFKPLSRVVAANSLPAGTGTQSPEQNTALKFST